MSRSLQGMVCIITGASSGIGAALARVLDSAGARLALAARRQDLLEALAGRLRGEHLVVPTDVADPEQCRRLVERAVDRFGRVDTLVANAGYGIDKKTIDTTHDEVAEMFTVNVFGTLDCARAAVEQMRRQEPRDGWRGQVMMTSSVLARRGIAYGGPYSATKAAQLSLAEAMRVELAPERIAVTSVHPSATESEFGAVARARGNANVRGVSSWVKPQSAEHVARRMAAAIRRPAREVWPARSMRYLFGINALFPGLGDYLVTRGTRRRLGE